MKCTFSYLLCQESPVPAHLCCGADVSRTEEGHDVERQKARQHCREVHLSDGDWFCQTITGEPKIRTKQSHCNLYETVEFLCVVRYQILCTENLLELSSGASPQQPTNKFFSLTVCPQVKPMEDESCSFLKKLHIYLVKLNVVSS